MTSNIAKFQLRPKALAIYGFAGLKVEREEFCIFNKCGEGFICGQQLKITLENIVGINVSEDNVNKLVNEVEIDGDGVISRYDLVNWVEQLEDFRDNIAVQNSVRAFDKAKNEFLSVSELKQLSCRRNEEISHSSIENIAYAPNKQKNDVGVTNETKDDCTRYDAFVTVLMQSKPYTKTGCKLQQYSAEGVSEIDEWRKRCRRNAAMRGGSVIFPKTWWLLLANLEIYVTKNENVKLRLKIYYWLKD